MSVVLWLLAIQGAIGGFDTVYYHEWRARLPALGAHAAPELKLHAARDFLYAVIFATLPWVAWQGSWALVLAVILLAEIVLTLRDFVVEITVRKVVGDVYGGERVTHAVMGIIYGSMLAFLIPNVVRWSQLPTAIVLAPVDVAPLLRVALAVMAAGVFVSGVRDLYAAYELPHGHWPWNRVKV
jgi:phosphatidylglycerophosphate synthase